MTAPTVEEALVEVQVTLGVVVERLQGYRERLEDVEQDLDGNGQPGAVQKASQALWNSRLALILAGGGAGISVRELLAGLLG